MQKTKAEKKPKPLENLELVGCKSGFFIFKSLQIKNNVFPKQKIFGFSQSVCVEAFDLCYKKEQTKRPNIHFQNFWTTTCQYGSRTRWTCLHFTLVAGFC